MVLQSDKDCKNNIKHIKKINTVKLFILSGRAKKYIVVAKRLYKIRLKLKKY